MAGESVNVAILFADIARSTQLYEVMGDHDAARLITSCLSCLWDVTLKNNGTVIKTIGDEIMSIFSSADDAVRAAKDMHQSFEHMPVIEGSGFGSVNIYVGIHYGMVIMDDDDVFGDAVNCAARLVSLAKQRQTLITEQAVHELKPEFRQSARRIGETTIKGKSGDFNIYEYVWEEEQVTVSLASAHSPSTSKSWLELRFCDTIVKIDENCPTVEIGRQDHNDLVLNYECVSRSHARIECRKGKFILIDQSSNGTYVDVQGGENIRVMRDELILKGSGVISPGRKASPGSPGAIHFAVYT